MVDVFMGEVGMEVGFGSVGIEVVISEVEMGSGSEVCALEMFGSLSV